MKFHYFNQAIPFLVSFVSAHGMLNENHYVKLFAFELIFIVMSASFVTVNRKNRPQNPYSETPRAAEKTRLTQPRVKKRVARFPDNRLQKDSDRRLLDDRYPVEHRVVERHALALAGNDLQALRADAELVHERIVDILGALVAQVLVYAAEYPSAYRHSR